MSITSDRVLRVCTGSCVTTSVIRIRIGEYFSFWKSTDFTVALDKNNKSITTRKYHLPSSAENTMRSCTKQCQKEWVVRHKRTSVTSLIFTTRVLRSTPVAFRINVAWFFTLYSLIDFYFFSTIYGYSNPVLIIVVLQTDVRGGATYREVLSVVSQSRGRREER